MQMFGDVRLFGCITSAKTHLVPNSDLFKLLQLLKHA